MSYRKNVVEALYVVHATAGKKKYRLRVQAASETMAKAKAEADLRHELSENGEVPAMKIGAVERIAPED